MNVTEIFVRTEGHAGDLLKTTYACVHSTTLALHVQNVRMTILVLVAVLYT